MPFHSESEEAWTDLAALVLALDVSQPTPHGIAPWYGQGWVIALLLIFDGVRHHLFDPLFLHGLWSGQA